MAPVDIPANIPATARSQPSFGAFTMREGWMPRDVAFVYAIKCGGAFKVGSAVDCEQRVAALQTGNPQPLELAHAERVGASHVLWAERQAQAALAEKLIRGEWFRARLGRVRTVLRQVAAEANARCWLMAAERRLEAHEAELIAEGMADEHLLRFGEAAPRPPLLPHYGRRRVLSR